MIPIQSMTIHTNFSDFILFLFVHMSQADSTYDPTEMATIKAKMKDLFPEETDFEKKLYGTIRQYNTFDKAKLGDFLQASLDHFAEKKPFLSELVEDLQEIIRADGRVDQSESRALEAFKVMLQKNR